MKRPIKGLRAFALVCAGGAVVAGPAQGAVTQKVSAATAVDRSCHASYAGGAGGTQTVTTTAPDTGLIRARLSGNGDWDLGVFDASSGRSVAGSAGFGSNELAEGFVKQGPEAACPGLPLPRQRVERRPSIGFVAIAERSTARCRSSTSTRAARKDKQRLQSSGSTSPSTATATPSRSSCMAPPTSASCATPASPTPSGSPISRRARRRDKTADEQVRRVEPQDPAAQRRNAYRHLADYNLELKQLAMRYPGLVKELTLNHQSRRGPRRQRHRDHPEPDRAGRQADLPAARRPPRA